MRDESDRLYQFYGESLSTSYDYVTRSWQAQEVYREVWWPDYEEVDYEEVSSLRREQRRRGRRRLVIAGIAGAVTAAVAVAAILNPLVRSVVLVALIIGGVAFVRLLFS